MTVAGLSLLFLRKLGYGVEDIAQPDALADFLPALHTWLEEGYARALLRLGTGADAMQPLRQETDVPSLLARSLQPALADYAAARALEERGETQRAALFHASFERAVSLHVRAAARVGGTMRVWNDL